MGSIEQLKVNVRMARDMAALDAEERERLEKTMA